MDGLLCSVQYKSVDESGYGIWCWYNNRMDVATDNYGKEGDPRWLREL